MPEADYLSSANPPGVGKSLLYVGGDTWGAWSGVIKPANGGTEIALEFTTPPKALRTNIIWAANFDQNNENAYIGIEVLIDGTIVILNRGETTSTGDFSVSFPYNLGPFILPGLSEIVIQVTASVGAGVDQFITLVATEL